MPPVNFDARALGLGPGTGARQPVAQGRLPQALSPREAANGLIVTARKRYNAGLAAPQPQVRLNALLEARQALTEIIDRLPTTDHAVALIGGDSVAGLSLPMVEEAIRATQTLIASDRGDPAAPSARSGAPETTASIRGAGAPDGTGPTGTSPTIALPRAQPFPGQQSGDQATGQGPAGVTSTACDTLAASPNDPTRTAPGVWPGALDTQAALAACEQAVALFPGEPRFAYQHGRALYSANRFGQAMALFNRAAAAGHKTARVQVAIMTLVGHGTTPDAATAIAALNAAMADDNPYANAVLGELHRSGRGVEQDQIRGLDLMRQAAEAGNPYAMQRMGQLLASGTETEAKTREALGWLRLAAEQNSPTALNLLGEFHRDGRGVEQNQSMALDFFRRAAEQGNPAAAYQVGVAAYQRGGAAGLSEGLRWMEQAAAGGEKASFYTLAYAYGFGQGTDRDARKSAGFMFQALETGSRTALTQMTQNAEQWPRDMRRALQIKLQEARLYRSSVDGNFGPATMEAIGALAERAQQKAAAGAAQATANQAQ